MTPRWPIILFDLDGTLADSIGLIISSHQYAVRHILGIHWPREEIVPWIGVSLHDTYAAVFPGAEDELERTYLAHNAEHIETDLTGYPGVAELLDELTSSGARCGIVTSKRRHVAERSARLAGIPASVPVVVGLHDTVLHKPHPEPLLAALTALDADASDAVYVGDSVYDLQAAHAVPLEAVGVTWGAGKREALESENPYALCSTVEQLRQALLL